MLKTYDELSEREQKLVQVMYSDRDTLEQYLYNFEGQKYIGRQYRPPEGVTKSGIQFGRIHIEVEPKEEVVEEVKEELPEKLVETQPVKKVSKKTKKK